jgi:hypothetical protein
MKKFTLYYGIILLALMFSVNEVLAHEVKLRMEDSDGNGIENGKARYGSGSNYQTAWWPGGLTQADGNTNSVDLPTGTYSFEMLYNGTSARKISVYIDSDVTLTWVTTTVTLQYSGRIRYGGPSGVLAWFKQSIATSTETKELLPGGTYKFRADPDGVFDLTIADPPSMTKSLIHLKLEDHNGDPLAGGTARGGHGSSYSSWWATVNPTNAAGVAVDIRDGLKTNLSYQMLYNNGGQVKGPQDVSSNSFFEFQTELVTLRLEKCDGTPLDGGKPRYGSGASYWTSFWPNGNTGWSAPGETTAELFMGTYSFDMMYNSTSDQKISQVVPDGGATFTWQTTEVSLWYSGIISYGGSGDSKFFNKPTMNLLPGTYNFNFRGANGNAYTALTFNGCDFEKSYVNLTVDKSDGSGQDGVSFVYQIHGSPPDAAVPGITGDNGLGVLLHELDGKVTNKVRYIPTYEDIDGVRRDPTPTTSSFAHWDMKSVRVELMSACDGLISASPDVEVTYEQPGNGRHNFGYIGTAGYFDKDVLPFGGFVALFIDDYQNSSDRINYYSADATITFQTTKCIDGGYGTTHYTEGGPWHVWPGSPMELLNHNGSWTAFMNAGGFYKAYLQPGKVYDINTQTFSDCPVVPKSGVISEVDNLNDFSYKLYPVPARTELNVNVTFEAKEKVRFQVVDITGRVMKQDVWMLNKGLNTMKVDVNDLVDGQYIFLLKSNDKVIKEKFSIFKN